VREFARRTLYSSTRRGSPALQLVTRLTEAPKWKQLRGLVTPKQVLPGHGHNVTGNERCKREHEPFRGLQLELTPCRHQAKNQSKPDNLVSELQQHRRPLQRVLQAARGREIQALSELSWPRIGARRYLVSVQYFYFDGIDSAGQNGRSSLYYILTSLSRICVPFRAECHAFPRVE
jgi:hypothetical protein